ncbi:conserved hypothetical protein [Paraburkholderia ribeironis]|uniref:Methyltransferase FkbM domain-containing protein n=1 Tax=Paraburkholderia ribeironis TaxID=1247936 RepID=A0A1N7SJA7_9BURK|nr:FkbM family methyltransferase [Paraburkholderia ribeironis]SIT47479.1 conserved hypothetical protein [Paraburkholderia ribeironis]
MSGKLIYDIGLHKGEDTKYYLSRGFRVVAVEADPDLVKYCETKLKEHVDANALKIIHGAVVDDDDLKAVKFYKNKKVSVWGTVVSKWADRNAMLGADSVEIEVPVINLAQLFSKFGCPYYLKIDIEGMDLVCLKKLFKSSCRPKYVSIESEKVAFNQLIKEFSILDSLGYSSFFIQQQADITKKKVPENSKEGLYIDFDFEYGCTGPFGSDLGSKWISREEAIKRYKDIFRYYRWFGDDSFLRRMPLGRYVLYTMSKLIGRPFPGWYDTHAKFSGPRLCSDERYCKEQSS